MPRTEGQYTVRRNTIRFHCSYCRNWLKADVADAGNQEHCPTCGGMIEVPGRDERERREASPRDEASDRRRKRVRVRTAGMIVVLAVFVGMGSVIALRFLNQPNEDASAGVAAATEPDDPAAARTPESESLVEQARRIRRERESAQSTAEHKGVSPSVGGPEALSAEALYTQTAPAVVRVQVFEDDEPVSFGSGFLISTEGLVVTNYHVVEGGTRATIALQDDRTFAVTGVAAHDSERDIAILKVSATSLPHLRLSESDMPAVGRKVYAIGNPRGLTATLSEGIISGHRKLRDFELLQTTAAISPGSSGGPLLAENGAVVGVTTAYLEGGQNLNFAVPADAIRRLLGGESRLTALRDLMPERPRFSLFEAARRGSLMQVRAHLRQDDVRTYINARDRSTGATALHAAVHEDHVEIVTLLLAAGADPNARVKGAPSLDPDDHENPSDWIDQYMPAYEGQTPIFAAQSTRIASALVGAGADVNARDDEQGTPLHWAAIGNHTDVIALLLRHGADPNTVNRLYRATPLHSAVLTSHLMTLRVKFYQDPITPEQRVASMVTLLRGGANPNAANSDGNTPLHIAAKHGDIAAVHALVDSRASVNLRNQNGETPMRIARDNGHEDVVHVLQRHGGRL